MNGVVLLVGGLLLAAVIKLIIDRNWMGLLLCVVALLDVYKRQAQSGITPMSPQMKPTCSSPLTRTTIKLWQR